MVVLGLLLVLLAVGAGAAVYLGAASLHGYTFTFDPLGAQLSTNPLGLALSGALVVLVFWLGWAILRLGARRAGRRRRAAKEAERQAEAERAETDQRREELAARERASQDEPPAPPPPSSGSTPTS